MIGRQYRKFKFRVISSFLEIYFFYNISIGLVISTFIYIISNDIVVKFSYAKKCKFLETDFFTFFPAF